jgi:hypothetical protein
MSLEQNIPNKFGDGWDNVTFFTEVGKKYKSGNIGKRCDYKTGIFSGTTHGSDMPMIDFIVSSVYLHKPFVKGILVHQKTNDHKIIDEINWEDGDTSELYKLKKYFPRLQLGREVAKL